MVTILSVGTTSSVNHLPCTTVLKTRYDSCRLEHAVISNYISITDLEKVNLFYCGFKATLARFQSTTRLTHFVKPVTHKNISQIMVIPTI